MVRDSVRMTKDSEIMNKIIINTIRRLPGITSTNTLIAIEEQGGKEYTDAVDLHGSKVRSSPKMSCSSEMKMI